MKNKKTIIKILIMTAIIILPASNALSKGLNMIGVWPYISPHETTISGNYLYQGKSNRIYAYDKATLNFICSSAALPVNDEIMSLFSTGTTIFAACGSGGIYIFDISNPEAGITLTGHYKDTNLTDFYTDLFIEDTNLYASIIIDSIQDDESTEINEYIPKSPGIVTIDISNSSEPEFISRISIPDPKKNMPILGIGQNTTIPSIAVKGINGKIFAFSSWAKVLLIYDITNPVAPAFRAYKPVLNLITDITADDQFVYLTNEGYGFMTENLDELEKEIPGHGEGFTILSAKNEDIFFCIYNQEGSYAESISINNDFACIADLKNGLQIIDISNPHDFNKDNYGTKESPNLSYGEQFLTGYFNSNISNAYAITLDNTTAYLSDQKTGMSRIDVSDPSTLTSTIAPFSPIDINVVSIFEEFICVTGMINSQHSFAVIDLLSLRLTAILELPTGISVSEITISRNGDNQTDKVYAYLTCGTDGVKIIEISNNEAVNQGIRQSIPGNNTQTVQISDNYAYIANGTAGISVFDISDPLSPVSKPVISIADAKDLKIKEIESGNTINRYLFAANGSNGISVFDITDPLAPQLTAESSTPQNAALLTLSDNYLFVADKKETPASIIFFNVSTPGSITNNTIAGKIEGTYTSSTNEMLSIAATDSYLFIAAGENGIAVIKVEDKSAPEVLSEYHTGVYSNNITVNTKALYLMTAAKNAGIIMYNVNLTEPFVPGPDYNKLFTDDKTPLKISNDGCFINMLK